MSQGYPGDITDKDIARWRGDLNPYAALLDRGPDMRLASAAAVNPAELARHAAPAVPDAQGQAAGIPAPPVPPPAAGPPAPPENPALLQASQRGEAAERGADELLPRALPVADLAAQRLEAILREPDRPDAPAKYGVKDRTVTTRTPSADILAGIQQMADADATAARLRSLGEAATADARYAVAKKAEDVAREQEALAVQSAEREARLDTQVNDAMRSVLEEQRAHAADKRTGFERIFGTSTGGKVLGYVVGALSGLVSARTGYDPIRVWARDLELEHEARGKEIGERTTNQQNIFSKLRESGMSRDKARNGALLAGYDVVQKDLAEQEAKYIEGPIGALFDQRGGPAGGPEASWQDRALSMFDAEGNYVPPGDQNPAGLVERGRRVMAAATPSGTAPQAAAGVPSEDTLLAMRDDLDSRIYAAAQAPTTSVNRDTVRSYITLAEARRDIIDKMLKAHAAAAAHGGQETHEKYGMIGGGGGNQRRKDEAARLALGHGEHVAGLGVRMAQPGGAGRAPGVAGYTADGVPISGQDRTLAHQVNKALDKDLQMVRAAERLARAMDASDPSTVGMWFTRLRGGTFPSTLTGPDKELYEAYQGITNRFGRQDSGAVINPSEWGKFYDIVGNNDPVAIRGAIRDFIGNARASTDAYMSPLRATPGGAVLADEITGTMFGSPRKPDATAPTAAPGGSVVRKR